MTDSGKLAFVGWHGLGLEHPAAWELNRVRGDRRKGGLVLDDGERVRLEMSWRPVRRGLSPERLAERQIKALERAASRRRRDIRIERRRLAGPGGFERECFVWNADVAAVEMVARCRDCGRTVLLRLTGDGELAPVEDARQVFSSLCCYCEKDWKRWGAFGLDVKTPARFELEGSSLKTGFCELTFSDRKVELRVGRASMGRAILEKQKLVAWYQNLAATLLRPFSVEWSERPFRGHIGYAAKGRVVPSRRLLGVFRSRRELRVHGFFCEPSDKIFIVSADGPGDLDALLAEVREGLVCHG